LTERYAGQHVIDHVGGGLDHAAGRARRADVAALAAEGHQEIVTTSGAVNPRKPVRRDAALEIGAKGPLDVEGNAPGEAVIPPGSREVGLEVVADDFVEDGSFGAAALVDRRAGSSGLDG
jgi:hypothetical protein